MCFIHPGNGEADKSVLTAFAIGVGKEVTIRLLRTTDPINASDIFWMETNKARNANELKAMQMLINVSKIT